MVRSVQGSPISRVGAKALAHVRTPELQDFKIDPKTWAHASTSYPQDTLVEDAS